MPLLVGAKCRPSARNTLLPIAQEGHRRESNATALLAVEQRQGIQREREADVILTCVEALGGLDVVRRGNDSHVDGLALRQSRNALRRPSEPDPAGPQDLDAPTQEERRPVARQPDPE